MLRGLAKDPRGRFRSADAFARAIAHVTPIAEAGYTASHQSRATAQAPTQDWHV